MSCDKFFDVPKQRLHVARKVKVILTSVFDEFGIRYLPGKVAAKLDGDRNIASAMKHKRRDLYVRKYRPDINLCIQDRDRLNRAGAGCQSLVLGKLIYGVLVRCLAR
jgi:hypothetical protein